MKKVKLFIVCCFLIVFSVFSQNKKYETYTVQKGETLQSISQKFSITPYNLIKLNPDLNNDGNLNEGRILIVPNKNFILNATNSDGKDYVKDGFLIHKVLPKENFFRLKKEYGVAKRILRKHNPILRVESLKEGQIIKIPVKKGYTIKEEKVQLTDTKPYIVKPKEAKYGISRRYGISIEKLEELNPQTKERDLKMAEIILVPNTAEIPDAKEGFITHRIEKGDNYFQFKQKFGITKEDLIAINPELIDGVKEGMLIKIPISEESSKLLFEPFIKPGKELNVALMLPFMSNKTTIDFEKNKTSNIATDFYLGSMMALESLKKQGLSINMKVFDTQNNKTLVSSYLVRNDFTDTDVIIGPMFLGNVKFVSKTLQNKDIPIISPVSQKDHSSIATNKIIQDMPSDEKLMNKVLDYIKTNYNGQNIVIFSDTTKVTMSKLIKTLEVLEPLDTLTKIEIIKPIKGYIKPEIFREKILEKKDNFILLVSNESVVTTDVVNNLGVLPKKVNATLFAFDKGASFKDISNNYLAHINFNYPTASFIDFENDNVKGFIKKYKLKNSVEPSLYAFKGFDITYDALLRFATHETISKALNAGVSERLCTKFEYNSNGHNKGFTNQGVYLVKYDGLNIVKVEEGTFRSRLTF